MTVIPTPHFPRRFQIQTQTGCNARCIFCPNKYLYNKIEKGKMSDELFRKIIDEIAEHDGVERVSLYLMNEPTLDKTLPEKVAYARSKLKKETEIAIDTNGSGLTQEMIEGLIDAGLDRLLVSIQGFSKETYEKIMVGLSYERMMENMERLIETMKRRKAKKPKIIVSMVTCGINEHEVRKFKRFWRKKGVKAASSVIKNRGGLIEGTKELFPYGLRGRRSCARPFRDMVILYNGDVPLCCMDWERKVIVGNVAENSIKDVWLGKTLNHIRECFNTGNFKALPDICKSCKDSELPHRHHRNLKGIVEYLISRLKRAS